MLANEISEIINDERWQEIDQTTNNSWNVCNKMYFFATYMLRNSERAEKRQDVPQGYMQHLPNSKPNPKIQTNPNIQNPKSQISFPDSLSRTTMTRHGYKKLGNYNVSTCCICNLMVLSSLIPSTSIYQPPIPRRDLCLW